MFFCFNILKSVAAVEQKLIKWHLIVHLLQQFFMHNCQELCDV